MTATQRIKSPPVPLSVGDYIDSKQLQIVQIIGKGAFGAVYAAKDVNTGALYAAKCLFPDRKSRKGTPLNVEQLFHHEVRLHVAAASHPNVLTLHRHFTECGLHFILFDFCAGSDLLTNITNHSWFWRRDDRIRAAFLQIIDGVAHCHAQGIAHRDLKPENILLMDQDAAQPLYVLADFGLASSRALTTSHGVGSKYYKSPECTLPERGCVRYSTLVSDIWALGIILINMITGRVPWAQAHVDDEHYSAYVKDRSYIMQYLPISTSLLPTLKRVLEPHPAARISLADLRDDIACVPHFHATDAELAHAPELARSVMADRAELLGVPFTLPPAVPPVQHPKGRSQKRGMSYALRTALSSEQSAPWDPQFQIAVHTRVATRAPALGPAQPYLHFTLDVQLADNQSRRMSLPRLTIASA